MLDQNELIDLIKHAENEAYEKAATIAETAPQHTHWRASREMAAFEIRSLKHP